MENYKQIIIIRKDLGMGTGKIAAQSSHAAVEALEKAKQKNPDWVKKWKETGQTKVVVKVKSEKELLEWKRKLANKFPTALIRDAGHTQIKPGTLTALGIGPAPEKELDRFTQELQLL
jgi:PTH2 family peptidyl-tRNA hydrolase